MRKTVRGALCAVAVAVSALALSACGGSDTGTPAGTPAASSVSAEPANMAEMMSRLGILSGTMADDQLFVLEGRDVSVNGIDATLATFATTGARDQWIDAVKTYGSHVAQGPKWAAESEDAATVAFVAHRLGGTVVA